MPPSKTFGISTLPSQPLGSVSSLQATTNTNCQALAFIDPAVKYSQSLIACGLLPGIKSVLLDSDRDGIQQISEVLKSYSQLQAIHIIAHGSPGCVYLGNSVLNEKTLPHYRAYLQSWQTALTENADILLYGCRVADTTNQISFLQDLADLTKANIAASTSITGDANQGGNWNLEFEIGCVSSPLAMTAATRRRYTGVLIALDVNTTEDENDGDADTGAGLSLRDAILIANNNPDRDYTIELTGGETYNLSLSDTDTSNFEISNPDAAVADLDIAGGANITVRGVGNSEAVIDASSLGSGGERRDRVFEILDNGSLTLENVRVTGGKVPENAARSANDGGGIYVKDNGELTLNNSTVSGNSAFLGGGLINLGTATLTQSEVSNNISYQGGGISNTTSLSADSGGNLTLTNSTVSGNTAYQAGGIRNTYSSATLTNSTVSGNSVVAGGGGISNLGNLTLANSTISGNSATFAGGLYNYRNATLANSTVAGNSADYGGGIYNLGSVTLANSIVANSAGGSDVLTENGTINTSGSNIVGDGSFIATNVLNQDPQLGSLSDNGGATQTHKPADGSVAIDTGDNDAVPADVQDLDGDGDTSEPIPYAQRGEGFTRVNNNTVDIGAVELQASERPQEILGSDVNEFLDGDLGNDAIAGFGGNDTINAGLGDDTVNGNIGDDLLAGEVGNDVIFGGQGNDILNAGEGNDLINGNLDRDNLNGSEGNDTIFGGQGGDILNGASGNDWLSGDLGEDTLTGAGGSDRFFLRPVSGSHTITDFEDGVDSLILPTSDFPLQPNGLTFADLTITQADTGTVISFNGNDLAILTGIDATNITQEDFQQISSL
ncbi:DUF4347 domain-containing protein [Geitlerinema sp. PCC 9228]|uniref:DUF4347 domain-containing protein n=1 Tax=Geitlerinema sp. PCC 9228 TaxID=111611 RepID=UPI0008F9854F|nr:DUF4347 domain-containing protein [Geitlerinema sp. PCC 9228]